MKPIYTTLLLCLLTVLVSCEKTIVDEQGGGIASSSELTEEIKNNALTVAQARETEGGTYVVVKGYIVAAAEGSIKKADYHKPFEGSSAILLAMQQSNGSNDQFLADEVIPVCLTTDAAKGLRDKFNLEDNSDRWNNFVYVSGMRKEYMSAPGLKKVQNIWIDYGHVPTEDEEAGEIVPQEGEEIEEGGEGDDSNSGVTELIDGVPVYTVAQILSKQILDKNIWVKGYIVASAKRSMESMDFEKPFDSNSAIIIADKMATPETIDYFKKNNEILLPVVFSSTFNDTKSKWNLKDNPDKWNRLVYIFGNYCGTSVGQKGLSPAISIKIADNN